MNKQAELDKIAKEIENCTECKVGKNGMAVPGEGNPDADVVFIGEAPGKTEALTGRPFIGRSGKLLRGLIKDAGLNDDEIFITSPVKYLPDRGTPTPADILHGREHLLKQLAVIQPKFVVLLGRVAAEGVLQKKVAVVKERGSIIEESEGVRYFLTYHPAAALRFPDKFKKFLIEDFYTVKQLIEST